MRAEWTRVEAMLLGIVLLSGHILKVELTIYLLTDWIWMCQQKKTKMTAKILT